MAGAQYDITTKLIIDAGSLDAFVTQFTSGLSRMQSAAKEAGSSGGAAAGRGTPERQQVRSEFLGEQQKLYSAVGTAQAQGAISETEAKSLTEGIRTASQEVAKALNQVAKDAGVAGTKFQAISEKSAASRVNEARSTETERLLAKAGFGTPAAAEPAKEQRAQSTPPTFDEKVFKATDSTAVQDALDKEAELRIHSNALIISRDSEAAEETAKVKLAYQGWVQAVNRAIEELSTTTVTDAAGANEVVKNRRRLANKLAEIVAREPSDIVQKATVNTARDDSRQSVKAVQLGLEPDASSEQVAIARQIEALNAKTAMLRATTANEGGLGEATIRYKDALEASKPPPIPKLPTEQVDPVDSLVATRERQILQAKAAGDSDSELAHVNAELAAVKEANKLPVYGPHLSEVLPEEKSPPPVPLTAIEARNAAYEKQREIAQAIVTNDQGLLDAAIEAKIAQQEAAKAIKEGAGGGASGGGGGGFLKGLMGGFGGGGSSGGVGDLAGQFFQFQMGFQMIEQGVGTFTKLLQQSEAVQMSLNQVNAQLTEMGQGDKFGAVADSIKKTAEATGLTIPQVATLSQEFLGLYGNVGQAAAATDDAAKLIRVMGGDAATAGPQIAALAEDLNTSVQSIGNSVIEIQNKTGRSMTDALAGMAGIAPVANELGLDLNNIRGLIEMVGASSARSGQQIGEGLARVLPALEKNLPKVGQLGITFSVQAKAGDATAAIKDLLAQYQNVSSQQQQGIIQQLGGPRNAQILAAALANPTKALGEFNSKINDNNLLNERNAAVQDSVKGTLDRLKAAVTSLGESILNSGIGQAFESIAGAAGVLVAVVEKLFSFFSTLNKETHGLVGSLLEVLLAMRALQAIGELGAFKSLVTGAEAIASSGLKDALGTIVKSGALAGQSILGLSAAKDVDTEATGNNVLATKASTDGLVAEIPLREADTAAIEAEAAAKATLNAESGGGLGAGAVGAERTVAQGAEYGGVRAWDSAATSGVAGFGGTEVQAAGRVIPAAETALVPAVEGATAAGVGAAPVVAPEAATFLGLGPAGIAIGVVAAAVTLTVGKWVRDSTQKRIKEVLTEYQKQVDDGIAKGVNQQIVTVGDGVGLVAGTTLAGQKAKDRVRPLADQVRRGFADVLDVPLAPIDAVTGLFAHQTGQKYVSTGTAVVGLVAGGSAGTYGDQQQKERTAMATAGRSDEATTLLQIANADNAKKIKDDLADPSNAKKHTDLLNRLNDLAQSPQGKTLLDAAKIKKASTAAFDSIFAGTDQTITSIAEAKTAFSSGDISQAQFLAAIDADLASISGWQGAAFDKQRMVDEALKIKTLSDSAYQSAKDQVQFAKDILGNSDPSLGVQIDTALLDKGGLDPAVAAKLAHDLETGARAVADKAISKASTLAELNKALNDPGFIDQATADAVNAANVKAGVDPTYKAIDAAEKANQAAATKREQLNRDLRHAGEQALSAADQQALNPDVVIPKEKLVNGPDQQQAAQSTAAAIIKANLDYSVAQATLAGANKETLDKLIQAATATQIAQWTATDKKLGVDPSKDLGILALQTQTLTEQNTLNKDVIAGYQAQAAYFQLLNKNNPIVAAQIGLAEVQKEIRASGLNVNTLVSGVQSGQDTNAEHIKLAQDYLTQSNALRDAQNARVAAQIAFAAAVATAAGNPVAAAALNVTAIQNQIKALKAAGAAVGGTALLTAQGQLVTAQAAFVQTQISTSESLIQTDLSLHRLTVGGAIERLKQLKQLATNQTQMDQIQLQIQTLESQAGANLGFNISAINLPSLYEVRRLNATPQGAGYSDNRTFSIQLNVNNQLDLAGAATMLANAVGVSTSRFGVAAQTR